MRRYLSLRIWFARFPWLVTGCFLLTTHGLASEATDGGLRVEVITAYNFVVDSNIESQSSYGPESAFIGAIIHNDGATTLSNVTAMTGDYIDGSSDTPGTYPSRPHMNLFGLLTGGSYDPQGEFALTHEGGSIGVAEATRFFGTLEPGASIPVYWLVSYPTKDALGHAVHGPSVKPDDDLWLEYDIWATADEGLTDRSAVVTRRATMRNEISAMANKILPNSVNKVPLYYQELLEKYAAEWISTNDDGTPGTRIIAEGVWYDLGNIGHGFDNDGDLVPDKNAWMQPVGNAGTFDAGLFRLIETRAFVVVKLKGGGEQVFQGENQLYFENMPENNGAIGWVGYTFMPLQGPGAAQLSPYQETASGYDNEKFNGDYGASLVEFLISGESRIILDKNATPTVIPGSNIFYSLSFTNDGEVAVGAPEFGLNMVISDKIPRGTTYLSGSATGSNTISMAGADYLVLYSTNNALTWSTEEPVPASAVTDIQWWMSDAFPTSEYGSVTFEVNATDPYVQPEPMICNTGGVGFGNGPPAVEDKDCTLVVGSNTVGDTVWADTGAGNAFANGYQNTDEVGVSNITVFLYWDANSNGLVDAGEPVLKSAVTDTNGNYLIEGLIDGNYLAVLDVTDPDIPFGYTLTTPETVVVPLDPGHADANPVSFLDADFGLAPSLTLTKELLDSSPVYEGQQITYEIDVYNNLPGNGTGLGGPLEYDVWANSVVAYDTGDVASPSNMLGNPDGLYGSLLFANNTDGIVVSDWQMSDQEGSPTNVSIVLDLGTVETGRAGDIVQIHLISGASDVILTNVLRSALVTDGQYELDVTADYIGTPWAWADFYSNKYEIGMYANKGGGSEGNRVYVDTIGFRVTSTILGDDADDATTLQPVPLTDHYDTNKLEFVSASPAQTSASTIGATGVLQWADIGPIYPGGTSTVSVVFNVLEPPSNTNNLITNTAFTVDAQFRNDWYSNNDTDSVVTVVLPTGEIGDFVWRDLDQDGVQDGSNETGIASVDVRLTPPTGVDVGNGPGVPITNTTDAAGYYLFSGLPTSGVYTVTVITNTLPVGSGSYVNTYDEDGTTNTPNSETLWDLDHDADDGTDTHLTADFGYLLPAIIDGLVWHDMNRSSNVMHDAGEPWLTNVTVTLVDSSGSTVATTSTDTNGHFEFIGNYSGTYTVLVNSASGELSVGTWDQTFDTDGLGSADQATISVVQGGSAHTDYSYAQTGTLAIGDTVFYDWNTNAIQDTADEGLPGVTMRLYNDTDGDGVVDAGDDTLIETTVTDIDGEYVFTNRPAGAYIVTLDETDLPANYVQTLDPDEPGVATNGDARGTVVLTTTNDWTIDFAYVAQNGPGSIGDTVWLDLNGDGAQAGFQETGISNITVSLYADLNSNGTYVLVTTMETDANGNYLFTTLPDGNYQVVVNTADSDLPKDGFGNTFVATTATTISTTISGGNTYLDADFGFVGYGAIGDTIFWDANQNGTQDWNEEGVSNVTVSLYHDVNTNGLYDPGDTFVTSEITNTNGFYLFTALAATNYIVLVDTNSATLTNVNAFISADPDADGVPASQVTNAWEKDSQTDVTLSVGQNFMGADFGYAPPGVIGDYLWLDTNGDGVQDAGELGIPYITMELRTNGVVIATTETDGDGYYFFQNLLDDSYTVNVATNDTNFPSGLVPTYDVDGTLDHTATPVVLSNAMIVVLGTNTTCTNCNMDVDFGYRYYGTNILSGTIGLDGPNYDGIMGSGSSGVDGDETPFADLYVYLNFFTDVNSNGVVDAGDTTTPLMSTTTSTNGDYSFTGLPPGNSNQYYVVSMAPPSLGLTLTTTNGTTVAMSLVQSTNAAGESLSAYQVVEIAPVTTNIDFAFRTPWNYDFGDLPQSYSTRLEDTPFGPRHVVPVVTNLYLGATVDYEPNGQPTPDASGDADDEDGVTTTTRWSDGPGSGNATVTVGAGTGWLVAWVDFNQSGDFTGPGEMVINQAVSSTGGSASNGVYFFSFNVPTGTISTVTNTILNTRFRLFNIEPSFSALAFSGGTANGEVEDHQFDFPAPTLVRLVSFRGFARGPDVFLEWKTAAEMRTAGFFLERLQPDGTYARVNEALIMSSPFNVNGATYTQLDSAARTGQTYTYRLIELELDGRKRTLGPYTVTIGGPALSLNDWSREMFSPAEMADASISGDAADPDGDGHSNYQEYLAGTIPTDGDSVLRLTGIRRVGDATVIEWLSEAGRIYAVDVAADIMVGFAPVVTNLPATPPQNSYTDTVERAEGVSYRVRGQMDAAE